MLTFCLAAFVAINARNLLTFGLTYFVNDWVTREGPLNVFNVLGSTFSKSYIIFVYKIILHFAAKEICFQEQKITC
jgi:hypothetical protein